MTGDSLGEVKGINEEDPPSEVSGENKPVGQDCASVGLEKADP